MAFAFISYISVVEQIKLMSEKFTLPVKTEFTVPVKSKPDIIIKTCDGDLPFQFAVELRVMLKFPKNKMHWWKFKTMVEMQKLKLEQLLEQAMAEQKAELEK